MPGNIDVAALPAEDLRRVVLSLSACLPITDEFESGALAERARRTVWYDTQRTHIAGWLAEYDSVGYYGRQKPGGGAKNFYNRFKCAGGLLWFAEALGVPGATLRTAVDAVSSAPLNPASQCGAFRAVVPWATVAPLLRTQVNARPRGLSGSIGDTVMSTARVAASALSTVASRARVLLQSDASD